MDVAEQPPFGGRRERGAPGELERAADVVDERAGEQQVAAQARVELRGLAAERRDADGVLQQPAGVRVVVVERRGVRREVSVAQRATHRRREAAMRDLAGEELEEPGELLRVATCGRRERRRVNRGRLDGAHVDLQTVAVPFDAPEDAYCVAFAEAGVEQVDVVPDPRFDQAGGVDELEREVRRAAARPQPALGLDRENAFDNAILGELRDRHRPSLGGGTDAATRLSRWPRSAPSARCATTSAPARWTTLWRRRTTSSAPRSGGHTSSAAHTTPSI